MVSCASMGSRCLPVPLVVRVTSALLGRQFFVLFCSSIVLFGCLYERVILIGDFPRRSGLPIIVMLLHVGAIAAGVAGDVGLRKVTVIIILIVLVIIRVML